MNKIEIIVKGRMKKKGEFYNKYKKLYGNLDINKVFDFKITIEEDIIFCRFTISIPQYKITFPILIRQLIKMYENKILLELLYRDYIDEITESEEFRIFLDTGKI